MNAQIRFGIAAVLGSVLLLVLAWTMSDSEGAAFTAAEDIAALSLLVFFAGVVLVIVGLIRRPAARD
jgi:hypothetical protein